MPTANPSVIVAQQIPNKGNNYYFELPYNYFVDADGDALNVYLQTSPTTWGTGGTVYFDNTTYTFHGAEPTDSTVQTVSPVLIAVDKFGGAITQTVQTSAGVALITTLPSTTLPTAGAAALSFTTKGGYVAKF